jgi:ABC-2 type transport system permease protein
VTAVAIPLSARPAPSTLQQWWTLTTRMIIPTLANGELATQVVGSIVFTVGFYLPLKNIMGAVQPMSSYAQYLTPLIALQAISFAAVSAAFRSALTPLAARMTASVYRCVIALTVSLICGHIIGFKFYGGWLNTIGFVVLSLLIGVGLALMGDLIGAATRNPEATAPLLLVPQVTLGLASVGLQPVERFPTWIQPFVRDQPLSQWLNALRAFAGDSTPAAPPATWSVIGPALAWVAAMIVVFTVLHARVAARRP